MFSMHVHYHAKVWDFLLLFWKTFSARMRSIDQVTDFYIGTKISILLLAAENSASSQE